MGAGAAVTFVPAFDSYDCDDAARNHWLMLPTLLSTLAQRNCYYSCCCCCSISFVAGVTIDSIDCPHTSIGGLCCELCPVELTDLPADSMDLLDLQTVTVDSIVHCHSRVTIGIGSVTLCHLRASWRRQHFRNCLSYHH